jgi:hypothetical protein
MAEEDGVDVNAVQKKSGAAGSAAVQEAVAHQEAMASNDDAVIVAEEKMTIKMGKEGEVESMEIKGVLLYTCLKDVAAHPLVVMGGAYVAEAESKGFQFQTNPKLMCKSVEFAKEGTLSCKKPDTVVPVGKPTGILRWRMKATDAEASEVPLSFTAWGEDAGGGQLSLTLSYTLEREDMTLQDVVISIPLGTSGEAPEIQNVDGVQRHIAREDRLEWVLDFVDADNKSGEIEFTVKASEESDFFPITVSFSSPNLMLAPQIQQITGVDGAPVNAAVTSSLTIEEFEIE